MRHAAIKTVYREHSTGLWVVKFIAGGELQETAHADQGESQNMAQQILLDAHKKKKCCGN